MNCLIFDIKKFHFAVPIDKIERIVDTYGRVHSLPLVPSFVAGITNWQGRIITIINLNYFFKYEKDDTVEFMFISNISKHIGYAIKKIEGFYDVADDELEDVEKFNIEKGKREYIKNICQTKEGKIISILDIEKIEHFLQNPNIWSNYEIQNSNM